MKIYLLPGLGYNSRIYDRLNLGDYKVRCLNWIEPEQNELISDYAKRLFVELPPNGEKTILIGHSFGGMVSQEIAAMKRVDKIILISSVKSRAEIPLSFRLVRRLGLHKFFTKEISIETVRYWGGAHGFTEIDEQDLFKTMVGEHSNNYLQWALKSLSNWAPPKIPSDTSIFQIHGAMDKTFPIRLIKNPDVVIENGSHIMLYKQPDKIAGIILNEINTAYNTS